MSRQFLFRRRWCLDAVYDDGGDFLAEFGMGQTDHRSFHHIGMP